jgi:ubiquinol-cytochrome c reductase iron-sulfur subunit
MSELLETSSVRAADLEQTTLIKSASSRRRFLTATTAVVGMVGATVATWPFLASWKPSDRAKVIGGPVLIDVSVIEPGSQIMVTWQGKPVWVLRRTSEMLDKLTHQHLIDDLADPNSEVASQQPSYAQNPLRSINPEILVVVALCTHLGCVPLYRPGALTETQGDEWMGGYYCPCHKSKFDLAGRVYKSVPAPTNLIVPPYQYLDVNTLVIGADNASRAA